MRPSAGRLEGPPGAARQRAGQRRFSPFDPEMLLEAGKLAAELSVAAHEPADAADGVGAVLDRIDAEVGTRQAGVIHHALSLFATHDPRGRLLRKPRLMTVSPGAVLPSARRDGAREGATGPEAILDYWRENAFANEHHQHWHEVYPGIGVVRPVAEIPPAIVAKVQQSGGLGALTNDELRQVFRRQDRHGELFVYMHQQMLARYDAERLSNGLRQVAPLDPDNLTAMIPEGFSPGPALADEFDPRPPGTVVSSGAAQTLAGWIGEIRSAIVRGAFATARGGTVEIDATTLGDQIEAVHPIWRGDVDAARYGNLHNAGHGVLASLSQPDAGVMISTETAIRDPIFYRWHRLVDDLSFAWQETQAPLELADAPPVTLAGADADWASHGILLVGTGGLPTAADGTVDETAAAALCEALFGGSAWDTPVAPGVLTGPAGEQVTVFERLTTRMLTAAFPDPEAPGETIDVDYPAHDAFSFVLRLRNLDADPRTVTARIFLCPAERADDRRWWIEMDKFPVTLAGGASVVIVRPDTASSVVKKPAEPRLAPDLLADADGDPRCDCGWPYTMLLPLGTQQGMDFRLMVMLTDGALDAVAPAGECGSLSFCGARDATYPDRREMGYPFHRRWPEPIGTVARQTASIAGRALTIEHVLVSG